MRTRIIAHRGASADAPENTMQAFMLAEQHQAHMLELDVHATADGEIVVFHDATTERWNGQAQHVVELTLNQMQQLNIRGEQVPTLAAVCEWASTTQLALNIEIKAQEIEAQVAQIARKYNLVERVIVSSFKQRVLQEMRSVAPDIALGVLTDANDQAVDDQPINPTWPLATLEQLNARAWHPSWRTPQLNALIPKVRAAGYAVYVWTVDDVSVMRQLLSLDVDGIITNRPALLRQVIQDWRPESPIKP